MVWELSDIERNTDTATELADADIIHGRKSPVKNPVAKVNVIDHLNQTGNANQSVYFLAFIDSRNLDFVVVVDFTGRVL